MSGLTTQQIKTTLKRLKEINEITTVNCGNYTLISMLNYEAYCILYRYTSTGLIDVEEKELPVAKALSPKSVVGMFHTQLKDLPAVQKITPQRHQRIKKLINTDLPSTEQWQSFFYKIYMSDFLMGRKTSWNCNIDWILKPANLIKIIEGNYDNKTNDMRGCTDDSWMDNSIIHSTVNTHKLLT